MLQELCQSMLLVPGVVLAPGIVPVSAPEMCQSLLLAPGVVLALGSLFLFLLQELCQFLLLAPGVV